MAFTKGVLQQGRAVRPASVAVAGTVAVCFCDLEKKLLNRSPHDGDAAGVGAGASWLAADDPSIPPVEQPDKSSAAVVAIAITA